MNKNCFLCIFKTKCFFFSQIQPEKLVTSSSWLICSHGSKLTFCTATTISVNHRIIPLIHNRNDQNLHNIWLKFMQFHLIKFSLFRIFISFFLLFYRFCHLLLDFDPLHPNSSNGPKERWMNDTKQHHTFINKMLLLIVIKIISEIITPTNIQNPQEFT